MSLTPTPGEAKKRVVRPPPYLGRSSAPPARVSPAGADTFALPLALAPPAWLPTVLLLWCVPSLAGRISAWPVGLTLTPPHPQTRTSATTTSVAPPPPALSPALAEPRTQPDPPSLVPWTVWPGPPDEADAHTHVPCARHELRVRPLLALVNGGGGCRAALARPRPAARLARTAPARARPEHHPARLSAPARALVGP